ncbi:MAG: HisA/HisF-related TIM barrel protein, partial [Lacticaseibacillus paracasei]
IAKDGMMQGPNAQLLADLQQAMPQATIIASGGISSLADLHRLQTAGIQAAIIGKAWQTGAIELAMLKQMEG